MTKPWHARRADHTQTFIPHNAVPAPLIPPCPTQLEPCFDCCNPTTHPLLWPGMHPNPATEGHARPPSLPHIRSTAGSIPADTDLCPDIGMEQHYRRLLGVVEDLPQQPLKQSPDVVLERGDRTVPIVHTATTLREIVRPIWGRRCTSCSHCMHKCGYGTGPLLSCTG